MKNIHINKKVTTIVNIILDKSGSMEEIKSGTIEGFNSYIKKLKKEDANILVSLTLFNTLVEKCYSLIPVKDVKLLDTETYDPDGGTALWDAAVDSTEECFERTKNMIENKPAILSVIITDGIENSSQRHERRCMNDLVEKLKAEGNWTFVYMGANQDSWANARSVSMDLGNTANFQPSNAGMKKTFNAMYVGTSQLSMKSMRGEGLNSADFLVSSKGENNELA